MLFRLALLFKDSAPSRASQYNQQKHVETIRTDVNDMCVCVRSVSFFFIKCTFILLKCFSPLLSDEAIPSSFGQCCQLLLRFDDNSIIIKAPTHRCRCHSAAQNCLVVIGQGAGEQMSTTEIAQSSKCFVYFFSCLTCIDDFLFKNIFQCLHLEKKRKKELMQ